jgi:excisionase family DNA binding protein
MVHHVAMPSETMTVREVLNLYGVSRSTLDRWINAGLLPVIQPYPRGERRFARADVEKLIMPKPAA